ncbi:Nn.00g006610.m01.CDS01 [Neocucurbitaria sp. VM-36]
MTTIHHSTAPGATPFAIYEDPEEQELSSPSEVFEGEMSFNSELSLPAVDEVVPSIEREQEPQDEPELAPYRSSYTSRKSSMQPRRSSGVTHYSLISAMPSETSISSKPVAPASHATNERYTPRKERPRFRNPESVRAMQMSSPPPLPAYEASRERTRGSYKLATPSRSGRSETPVSRRSGSHRGSIREHHSPIPTPTPQQAPLVLLHVTILPMQVPFSHDMMVKIMPDWLVENYKLLEEKLQDIILMRRGLLIPHPRDEYELLEERILENLELKTPRLLKCGHFVPPDDDTDREEDDDDMASIADDATGRRSRMSGGTLTEDNKWGENMLDDSCMCTDCHRELKKPGKGVGAGTRKWDIKIYAANGLMRAAAWSACWNDMERCDVEISPWIPEELRKTLERRVQEEQEAEKRKQMYAVELQRQIQDATAKQKVLEEEACERKKLEELELQKSYEAVAVALERSVEEKAAERRKFEEALQEKIEEAKESIRLELGARALTESSAVAERLRALEDALKEHKREQGSQQKPSSTKATPATQPRKGQRSIPHRPQTTDIPLSTLLKNYFLVLLGDQRNFIILVLSALVVFLSMNMDTTWKQQLLPPPRVESLNNGVLNDLMSPIAVTATTTATSFSTLTVTEVHTAHISLRTDGPSHELTNMLVEEIEVPNPVGAALSASASEIEDVAVAAVAEQEIPTSKAEATAHLKESTTMEDLEPAVEDPVIEKPPVDTLSATEHTIHDANICIPDPIFQFPTTFCTKHEQ